MRYSGCWAEREVRIQLHVPTDFTPLAGKRGTRLDVVTKADVDCETRSRALITRSCAV
jgi:hypothetical protein